MLEEMERAIGKRIRGGVEAPRVATKSPKVLKSALLKGTLRRIHRAKRQRAKGLSPRPHAPWLQGNQGEEERDDVAAALEFGLDAVLEAAASPLAGGGGKSAAGLKHRKETGDAVVRAMSFSSADLSSGEDSSFVALVEEFKTGVTMLCTCCGKAWGDGGSRLVCTERCGHLACTGCLVEHVMTGVAAGRVAGLSCPEPGCAAALDVAQLQAVLSAEQFTRFLDAGLAEFIASDELSVRCPHAACATAFSYVPGGGGGASSGEDSAAAAAAAAAAAGMSLDAYRHYCCARLRCPTDECGRDFCALCLVQPYHRGLSCEEAAAATSSARCRYCDEVLATPALPAAGTAAATGGGAVAAAAAAAVLTSPSNGNSSAAAAAAALPADVCSSDECGWRWRHACKKMLCCGHSCGGVEGESPCLPCLREECSAVRRSGAAAAAAGASSPAASAAVAGAGVSAGSAQAAFHEMAAEEATRELLLLLPSDGNDEKLAAGGCEKACRRSQGNRGGAESSNAAAGAAEAAVAAYASLIGRCGAVSDDLCAICYVEELGRAPALLLDCGHAFHLHCTLAALQRKWSGSRITFGFLRCPLCACLLQRALAPAASAAVSTAAPSSLPCGCGQPGDFGLRALCSSDGGGGGGALISPETGVLSQLLAPLLRSLHELYGGLRDAALRRLLLEGVQAAAAAGNEAAAAARGKSQASLPALSREERLVTLVTYFNSTACKYYRCPGRCALESFAFYPCSRCARPYYGGRRACGEDGVAVPQDGLVCFQCAGAVRGECGKRGHAEYTLWKCRFCCSAATWFCFGTTHFCHACHDRWVVGWLRQGAASPGVRRCGGAATCPLGVDHPPNGEAEHALGCGLCCDEDLQERAIAMGSSKAEDGVGVAVEVEGLTSVNRLAEATAAAAPPRPPVKEQQPQEQQAAAPLIAPVPPVRVGAAVAPFEEGVTGVKPGGCCLVA